MNKPRMQIKVDFRSNQPIYIQIMEQIREMVAAGELKQGDQLPTVRQLATELRVNFNTVARAYRLLDESGLISTQKGRGTFIWEKPSEDTLQSLRQQSLENLTRQYLIEATRMGFSTEDIASIVLTSLQQRKEKGPHPPTENHHT